MPRPLSRWERDWLPPIFAGSITLLVLLWIFQPKPKPGPIAGVGRSRAAADGYVFRSWNVENFYDDQDDPRVRDQDENWFGQRPDLVREKVAHLVDAILLDNDGRGADILALVEVENLRAVELLRDALNARLDESLRYRNIVFRENRSGRHIAPAVLTRLNARDDLTRDFGIRRILEAHLEAEGIPLVVIVSHWTSRVTDKTELKRSAYGDSVYRAFLRIFRDDPTADVILSGDFNDEPGAPALIEGLNATGDPNRVREDDRRPKLLDLMAGRDPRRFGTYYYQGRWQALDHIVASPGLLDPKGWSIDVDSLRAVNDSMLREGRNGRPFRFGGPNSTAARGYSDHFAVTVRLKLAPKAVAVADPRP